MRDSFVTKLQKGEWEIDQWLPVFHPDTKTWRNGIIQEVLPANLGGESLYYLRGETTGWFTKTFLLEQVKNWLQTYDKRIG